MKISIERCALRHMLIGLLNDPDIIELGFNFQISGKIDTGEYVIRNGSASFMFDSTFVYVSYNGSNFDLNDWFDGDISYHDDINDPNMDYISIAYCNRK